MQKISTKRKIIWGIIILLIFVAGFFLWLFDHFADEERDYALNREMVKLAQELHTYKDQHRKYPENILEIRSSDILCVTYLYPKCQQVHYKPIRNFQDFRLAMKSFSWVILWYRKDACFSFDRERPKNPIAIYYFCAASPEGSPHDVFPEYRKDKKIFDNPSEWPVL